MYKYRKTHTHTKKTMLLYSIPHIHHRHLPIMCCVFYFLKNLYTQFSCSLLCFSLFFLITLCRFSFIQLIYAFGFVFGRCFLKSILLFTTLRANNWNAHKIKKNTGDILCIQGFSENLY